MIQKFFQAPLVGGDGVGGGRHGTADHDVVGADLSGAGGRGDAYLVVLGRIRETDARRDRQELRAAGADFLVQEPADLVRLSTAAP